MVALISGVPNRDTASVTLTLKVSRDTRRVTTSQNGDEKMWKTCVLCGKELDFPKRSDCKTCGSTCRKRLERKKENHEKAMRQAERFLWSLEEEDLRRLQTIISERLQNV